MQSVLVKIVPPAQTPAPCDQRTARVRTTVDLCLDLLAKVLRSATVRSAILREENRVSLGPPAQKSAPCELRGARCDRRNRTACATVCELRAVPCELQSCLSTCLASMLRAAICELRLATGPQLADCGSRIAARGFAARPSSSVDTMRTCLASILRAAICDVHLADGLRLTDCGSQNGGWPPGAGRAHLFGTPQDRNPQKRPVLPPISTPPRCSHLLGRELSQVAPRRNWGLVACDVVSWSRVQPKTPLS